MAGWFARLVGRTEAVRPPAAVGGVVSPPPADAPPAGDDAPAAAPAGYGVRSPLVGLQGAVAGFELALPPALHERLSDRGDSAAAAAHHMLLLAAAAPLCRGRRVALVAVDAVTLARPGMARQAPGGAWLCVEGLATLPPAFVQSLRARGVRLGVPDGPPGDAPAADFVLLRGTDGGLDTLLLSAQRWRGAPSPPALVACGLQRLDDVERLLGSGFALAGGVLDRTAAAPASRPLSAAAHRICELLDHLVLDHATTAVADAVRADVALSYRLLRYANSPAVGLRRSVETVDDAVTLLGRQELHRWLSVLLLTVADSRQASRALQEMALARGRLLELLARARDEPAPATLFTVGMLSLIEVLLQVPLTEAVSPLRLSEPVRHALLRRHGPYAVYLDLAQALDGGDAATLERLAAAWGGGEAVRALAEQAWDWAEAVAAAAVAPAPGTAARPAVGAAAATAG